MTDTAAGRDGWDALLDAVEDASPVEAVEAVSRRAGLTLGASAVSFLIADLSGRGLVRLTHVPLTDVPLTDVPLTDVPLDGQVGRDETPDGVTVERRDAQEVATSVPFDGGPAEEALRTQLVQVQPPTPRSGDALWTVFAPVTERGEALGLLEFSLPAEPDPAAVREIARTAHLLGFVVVASRRHTDLYEWGQRSTPFSLSAEVQRRLLPDAFTCEAGSFILSAWLEPADSVGGDTFDYSLARDVLHLSMTDAMGHGVASSLTATLCVGSLRNTRRHGVTLLEQARLVNAALIEHGAALVTETFSTGLLARVDLHTGDLTMVNAGHALPYLLRSGAVDTVELPPDLPFGLFPDTAYRSTTLRLVAGDRVVFVTDGMLERNAAFLDLPDLIAKSGSLHPREATRVLANQVLEASGQALADDAALLLLDWNGNHGRGRDTTAGTATRPG